MELESGRGEEVGEGNVGEGVIVGEEEFLDPYKFKLQPFSRDGIMGPLSPGGGEYWVSVI